LLQLFQLVLEIVQFLEIVVVKAGRRQEISRSGRGGESGDGSPPLLGVAFDRTALCVAPVSPTAVTAWS